MCGIAGWFDLSPQSRDMLKKMTDALYHRGPDEGSVFCQDCIALGHRRLAMVDLTASHQPMACEGNVLVYNGELYNFQELRKELIELGHTFKTNGDTEVLLHALIEWKVAALTKLQGMFAFAFWDGDSLLLARDHLGIKPLYYVYEPNRILFASEIKALLEHPAVSREIDLDAISLYLECQYIPAPYSVFKSIKKLPAAHYIVFNQGRMQQKRYWTPSYLPKYEMDEVVAVEELEKQLRNSVRSMMIADVPLGVFVSGGIDSSLIASLMQAESGKKVKIFSIALDEHKYATQVACYLNAEYYPLTITAKDIVGALDQMFDEPFGDQAALPTLLLSKLTSKHLKGVMTGEGADEVFAGYNNYVKRLKQARFCDKYRPFGLSYLYPLLPMKLRKDRFVKALSRPISRRYTTIASLFDSEMHRRILKFRSKITLEDLAEPLYHNCNSNEYLDRMLHIDQNLWLAEDLLTKVDRATMTYSLEARVPYLDHRLVEFAARLPVSYKLKEGNGKYLLKQVAKKGFVPPQIIQRPKSGFVLPLHQWMQQDLKPVMKDALASLCNRSLFKRGFLNKKHHPTRLFALLALEFWFRRYAPHYKISKVAK